MTYKIGTLEYAKQEGQRLANKMGSSVLIYRSQLREDEPAVYGVAYTVPCFAERIGDRIYPQPDDVDITATQDHELVEDF